MSERSLTDQNGDDPSSSNIQVIISSPVSDRISTPTGPAGEEEMSFLKQQLYNCAMCNEWSVVKSIFDRYPGMVRIPLTGRGDTALHVAVVGGGRETFMREFVNYEHVTKQDLAIRNANGNTAFCLAAITGKRELLDIMIQKNEDLPLIHGQHGMLPVHLALLNGFGEIGQHMSSQSLLGKMALKDIERLFFTAINGNIYDLAVKLVYQYPEPLSIARDDEDNLTALHILARRPPKKNTIIGGDFLLLFGKLWHLVITQLEYSKRMELITKPSLVIFDAIKSRSFHVMVSLFKSNDQASDLMMLKDPENGQNALQIAVLFRYGRAINFILDNVWNPNLIIRAVDRNHDNVLHFAARQLEGTSLSLRPDIRMRKELEWFKEMEERFPPELSTMRNKYDMTPNDAFYANHRKLSNEVKDTAKTVANSGMVVAALVVTVAFAAALTTPGGDKNYNTWFVVFIMANAVALLTSSLSILAFLSIFTSSRFEESDFVTSMYPNLIIGKVLLFISVVTMIIAFAAASFLIFGHTYKPVAYVVAWFSLLTIIMFLGLQLNLFDGLVNYFGSR